MGRRRAGSPDFAASPSLRRPRRSMRATSYYKVTPQIAGAIKAVPGVVEVQAV